MAEKSSSVTINLPTLRSIKFATVSKAVLIALGLYVAYLVREIWIPVGAGFILALVLDPIVDRLELKGHSRMRASVLIFTGALISVIALSLLVAPLAISQYETLHERMVQMFPDHTKAGIQASLSKLGMSQPISQFIAQKASESGSSAESYLPKLVSYVPSMSSSLIWIVLIPIIGFTALKDFHLILAKIMVLLPADKRSNFTDMVHEAAGIFSSYFRGMLIVSLLNGFATFALLAALRIPGSLLLGLFAALVYPIPYIGAILTVISTFLFAFVGVGPHVALVAVGLSVILHQVIFDQIVVPRVLGNQVGLHPLLSIIAILSGQIMFGIVGMLLAVPISACIQQIVVTLQPKLAAEIVIPPPADIDLPDASEEAHTPSQDLHGAVALAVVVAEQ